MRLYLSKEFQRFHLIGKQLFYSLHYGNFCRYLKLAKEMPTKLQMGQTNADDILYLARESLVQL